MLQHDKSMNQQDVMLKHNLQGCTWNNKNALSRIVTARVQIGHLAAIFAA